MQKVVLKVVSFFLMWCNAVITASKLLVTIWLEVSIMLQLSRRSNLFASRATCRLGRLGDLATTSSVITSSARHVAAPAISLKVRFCTHTTAIYQELVARKKDGKRICKKKCLTEPWHSDSDNSITLFTPHAVSATYSNDHLFWEAVLIQIFLPYIRWFFCISKVQFCRHGRCQWLF